MLAFTPLPFLEILVIKKMEKIISVGMVDTHFVKAVIFHYFSFFFIQVL